MRTLSRLYDVSSKADRLSKKKLRMWYDTG